MKPMLDPKRDLAGATPEKRARAPELRPLSATRSPQRRLRPMSRATVWRIWSSVPDSRMLWRPANSRT